jgi:hypothetical protein
MWTSGNSLGSSILNDSGTAISVLAGSGHGKIWRYGLNSSSWSPVKGIADVGINSRVCTGGGMTGEHCGLVVHSMDALWNDGYGWFYMILAHDPTGIAAAGRGDSGGPVFVTGSSGVYAAGIIQWGDVAVPCSQYVEWTQCFNTVGFSSVHSFLNNQPSYSLRVA